MIVFENISFTYAETDTSVFKDFSLTLPEGIVSFIGQNATGKSTLLLLASGRLLPSRGRVLLNGIDTRSFKNEEERARQAAFIYQNMEFETEEPVENLLTYVYETGFHENKDLSFVDELIEVFELASCLKKKTAFLSKGEMQRLILAFSLLYGSKTIMMDEPVFAMENYQKHRALAYIMNYAKKKGISIFYSLHELELSQKYSDYLLIFYKNRPPRLGPTAELFKKEIIEEAYEVPLEMLKMRETIYRDGLIRLEGRGPSQGQIDSEKNNN